MKRTISFPGKKLLSYNWRDILKFQQNNICQQYSKLVLGLKFNWLLIYKDYSIKKSINIYKNESDVLQI